MGGPHQSAMTGPVSLLKSVGRIAARLLDELLLLLQEVLLQEVTEMRVCVAKKPGCEDAGT